ncbi:alpha-glucuronidase family glycosyl hydrolase [Hyphomonas sp.]|jgi:alpha-glucuronidase|uniref:alpha-glucuronidase family glycosyl hydrolase n=1 Tax=Hyphomonas sp. TaxID=87 RepID=UPI0032D98E05
MKRVASLFISVSIGFGVLPAAAEDGYELWLRYEQLEARPADVPRHVMAACAEPSETIQVALAEIDRATESLLGTALKSTDNLRSRTLVLASADCANAIDEADLPTNEAVGAEGFTLRATKLNGKRVTLIAAQSDIGVLYGTFDYLQRMSRDEAFADIDITSRPKTKLRLLNHWDNLDRHVERGYAGQSIWDWHRLPDYLDPKYTDYARANASIGINGVSLTNVNADATVLTGPYLEKVAALADIFRPYGIKVYLTARFSAPMELGGLDTADPRNAEVQAWWQAKVDEIYTYVPDFGGFLVKANSEGQPGPQDYERSHAEGANMLATALAPHEGVVMWRAFVYSAEEPEDRVKQAYTEFVPLDGQFADNVLVQVKNGPLDFQPREPFHPLFGAMPETPLMMELQITKEYLGFSTHLAYLGTLWEEVLSADTHAKGEGPSVASVIDGAAHEYELTGMAGVANIGSDRNWSGSVFDQANWYAFGRLAWDPDASAETIARDWVEQTFSRAPEVADEITRMMMGSREAVVNYMTPLGLTHLMGTGHHHGPAPWVDDLGRADWTPYYYHKATKDAVGFDRTETGSGAVDQYAGPLAQQWASLDTVPDELLLWFHRVSWDYQLSNGQTLWHELVSRYDQGVNAVETMQAQWAALEKEIDAERFAQVSAFLGIQHQEAIWWRDASIAYWQSVNGLPLPEGAEPPAHDLGHYKSLSFPNAPGQGE